MRILVIEDDAGTAELMVGSFLDCGHDAVTEATGTAGLMQAEAGGFDAIVLDRLLPGTMDGIDVLGALRARQDATPVLMLSALSDVEDRVQGLKAGADDYLAKPYAFSELLARMEALVRRGRPGPATRLQVGDLELDLLTRMVRRRGQRVELQPREFRLLEYLMRHAGEVVTRTMLLEGVWDYNFDPQTNVIDVHVSRLRQKVDRPFGGAMIQTVRNAGYLLQGEEIATAGAATPSPGGRGLG